MGNELFNLFNEGHSDESKERRDSYVRAPFPYPGGKSKSIQELLKHLPYRNGYISVCGGSGCDLLAREHSKLEVFNDRYSGVVSFYRVLRDSGKCQQLQDRLEHTLHSREEFVWCKETWLNCDDDVERAARWYYMMYNSFAALGRNFGRSTSGNAMFGRKLKNMLPYLDSVHKRLRNVQIENLDFRQCLKDYDDSNHVFYIDPTYVGSSPGIYEHELSMGDHKALCDLVMDMRGFVAISNYDNELYNSYDWSDKITWEVHITTTAKSFTSENHQQDLQYAERSKRATEVLYIKEAT